MLSQRAIRVAKRAEHTNENQNSVQNRKSHPKDPHDPQVTQIEDNIRVNNKILQFYVLNF